MSCVPRPRFLDVLFLRPSRKGSFDCVQDDRIRSGETPQTEPS